MILRGVITIVMSVVCMHFSLAQGESNIWYFGKGAGIDFNSGTPTALTNGGLHTGEGCASISDRNGNLLFYTDGDTVWNKNHVNMPNGYGLWGDNSSTQSAIIVPQPTSDSIYYIFTTIGGSFGGFAYSIMDLTLQGGLGDITTKNSLLYTPTTERLTVVRHNNNIDYWIITHELDNDVFRAYLLTTTGINPTPVISTIGLVHSDFDSNYIGYLKVSPNDSKLAVAIWQIDPASNWTNSFELFDFDNATGMISNPIVLPAVYDSRAHGIEFSPDNTKLYVGLTDDIGIVAGRIYQFDLQSGVDTTIVNSMTLIGNSATIGMGALQLGPDGKIYVARVLSTYLGVINNPDSLGTASNYVDNGVDLLGKVCWLGLPPINMADTLATGIGIKEYPNLLLFEIYPNPATENVSLQMENDLSEDTEILLTDGTGKLIQVISKDVKLQKNNTIMFNVSHLSNGLYFITVKNNNTLYSREMVVFH